MSQTKNIKKIISVCLNVLIIVGVIFGVFAIFKNYFSNMAQKESPFILFTNDGGILLSVSSLIYIVFVLFFSKKKDVPKFVTLFRFIASTASLLAFVIAVVSVFVPQTEQGNGFVATLFSWDNGHLFLHFICPLISFVSFAFFEDDNHLRFWESLYATIPTVLYACVWIVLELVDVKYQNSAPYSFLRIYGVPVYEPILYAVGMFLSTWVLGLAHLLLHNAFVRKESESETSFSKEDVKTEGSSIITAFGKAKKDDVVVIEDSEDDELQEEEDEIKAEEAAKAMNPTGYQNGPRVYHIAKQASSGKWQVRLATGQKAIKLFDTQVQAIDYAKGLVRTQGGSIRVHSLQGKMRKQ